MIKDHTAATKITTNGRDFAWRSQQTAVNVGYGLPAPGRLLFTHTFVVTVEKTVPVSGITTDTGRSRDAAIAE